MLKEKRINTAEISMEEQGVKGKHMSIDLEMCFSWSGKCFPRSGSRCTNCWENVSTAAVSTMLLVPVLAPILPFTAFCDSLKCVITLSRSKGHRLQIKMEGMSQPSPFTFSDIFFFPEDNFYHLKRFCIRLMWAQVIIIGLISSSVSHRWDDMSGRTS